MARIRPTITLHAFSLLEMMVVLAIIGGSYALICGQSQKVTQTASNCYTSTQAELVTVRTSIDHFVRMNNRYPAPAGRMMGTASQLYGMETSGSDIDVAANGTNPILFGALPFQTLGLPASFAVDCWGNQFSYAVTASLTMTASNSPATPPQGFNNLAAIGGLTIKSGTAAAPTILLTNAAYAVISHGATGTNGNGGVAINNQSTHGWCSGTATLDHYNCNLGATLFSATFNDGTNAGANFFDDLVIFAAKATSNCNMPSLPVTWSIGSNTCNGTFSGPVANTATELVVAQDATMTGSASFTCKSGTPTLATVPAPTCAPVPPVNGACGSAHNGSFQLLPTLNLCSQGTASIVNETATLFSWTCSGAGGGTTAACKATPVCKCGGITLICMNPRNPFSGLNLLGITIICSP